MEIEACMDDIQSIAAAYSVPKIVLHRFHNSVDLIACLLLSV